MRLEIYKEKEEEKEEEEVTKLRLIRTCHGMICLAAVDDDGNILDDGIIASILSNGTLRLFNSVNSKLGFQLDEDGNIIVEKEVS